MSISGKRVRICRGQTKYGCFTCKTRRVKCGMERPVCLRCTRSRVTCQGYPDGAPEPENDSQQQSLAVLRPGDQTWNNTRTPGSSSSTTIIRNPSTSFSWGSGTTQQEAFSIRYALQLISHHYVDEFEFIRVILDDMLYKCSYICPSTQAAAAALGAASEQQRHQRQGSLELASRQELNYNKALRLLRTDLKSQSCGALSVLFSCILLVCTELILRRRRNALLHLHAAYRLTPLLPSSAQDTSRSSLDLLLRTFDVQTLTFSHCARLPGIEPLPLMVADHTKCLVVDITLLDKHIIQTVHTNQSFIVATAFSMCQNRTTPDFTVQHGRQIAAIRCCIALTQSWLDRSSNGMRQRAHLLRIHNICLATFIELSTLCAVSETSYDAYIPEFEQIVAGAEEILVTRRRNVQDPMDIDMSAFSLPLGIIQPLNLTAKKCRHGLWRRRAIECLRQAGREGPWIGSALAAVAERSMQIEEGDSPSPNPDNAPSPISFASDSRAVPEERRLTVCRPLAEGGFFRKDDQPVDAFVLPTSSKIQFIRRRYATSSLVARTLSSTHRGQIIETHNFHHRSLDPNTWEIWVEEMSSDLL